MRFQVLNVKIISAWRDFDSDSSDLLCTVTVQFTFTFEAFVRNRLHGRGKQRQRK